MEIWPAGVCNIKGCTRDRSLLWHGDKLVGNHAHCCCMCRLTNGREYAYYCREEGHHYLKDDRRTYSQVFVKDNGRDAAEAAWYSKSWSSWQSGSWSSNRGGAGEEDSAKAAEDAGEEDSAEAADAAKLEDDAELSRDDAVAESSSWSATQVRAPEGEPQTSNDEFSEEEFEDEEAEWTFSGVDSFSGDEWPTSTAE